MTKSHHDYHIYTPELVNELKDLVAGVPRAVGVKRLINRLNISDRSGRRVYERYIDGAAPVVAVVSSVVSPEVGRPIRRLFYDIETSPNIGLFWRAGFKLNIGADAIIKERAIICIGYKWAGDKKTHVIRWDDNQDDKAMLSQFIEVLAQADEAIGHNLDRFDMPWVRTRCLFHGLPPLPDVKQVDTLKWAKSRFYFNSNKLDYIAKFLGIGGKIKTGFDLWRDILLNKCPDAMLKMMDYCKHDVVLLEKVWQRLSDSAPAKTHVGVMAGGDKWTCPRTGSTNVCVNKTVVTAAGVTKYRMRNRDTGSYFSITATAHEAYLEAKGRKTEWVQDVPGGTARKVNIQS